MSERVYTQEQVDLELLKNNQSNLSRTLERIEQAFHRLEQKVDSHFHWTIGLIFGMYAMSVTGLMIIHAYGWF